MRNKFFGIFPSEGKAENHFNPFFEKENIAMTTETLPVEMEIEVENETTETTETPKKVKRVRADVNISLVFDSKESAEQSPPKVQGWMSTINNTPDGPVIVKTADDSKTTIADGYYLYIVIRPDNSQAFVWARNPEQARSIVTESLYSVSLADPSAKGRQWTPDPSVTKMLDILQAIDQREALEEFILKNKDKKMRKYGPLYGVIVPPDND